MGGPLLSGRPAEMVHRGASFRESVGREDPRWALGVGAAPSPCRHTGRSPEWVAMAGWLQRWNFIERAKLERELWEAFERGEPLEVLVEQCEPGFRKEVWTTTLQRIRKIEQLMQGQSAPEQAADSTDG